MLANGCLSKKTCNPSIVFPCHLKVERWTSKVLPNQMCLSSLVHKEEMKNVFRVALHYKILCYIV